MVANIISIIVIAVILGFAISRIVKSKKNGGCCGCDCGGGCSGNCCSSCSGIPEEPENPDKPIKIN